MRRRAIFFSLERFFGSVLLQMSRGFCVAVLLLGIKLLGAHHGNLKENYGMRQNPYDALQQFLLETSQHQSACHANSHLWRAQVRSGVCKICTPVIFFEWREVLSIYMA